MKITVLTGLEKPDPKSYDVVADQVAAALRKKGHKTSILGVYDDVSKLISGISRRKPDLIFNLLESFGGKSTAGDFAIAGVLDLLGVRYTGGGPGELYLRQDKGLAKKVLAFGSYRSTNPWGVTFDDWGQHVASHPGDFLLDDISRPLQVMLASGRVGLLARDAVLRRFAIVLR